MQETAHRAFEGHDHFLVFIEQGNGLLGDCFYFEAEQQLVYNIEYPREVGRLLYTEAPGSLLQLFSLRAGLGVFLAQIWRDVVCFELDHFIHQPNDAIDLFTAFGALRFLIQRDVLDLDTFIGTLPPDELATFRQVAGHNLLKR